MTWRDQYQKGSFRGAAFRTQGHERGSGRRAVINEFPGRDEPETEDLGRRARTYSIDCHVLGTDYINARDKLIDALEAAGPGLLVHPWHGEMMVVVLDFTTRESTEEGGVCFFQISFGEAGLPVSAPMSAPSGTASKAAATKAKANAPGRLAKTFRISKAAAFVEAATGKVVMGITTVSLIAAGLRGGAGAALRALGVAADFLPSNLAALVRAPIALGQAVVGLVSAVAALAGSASAKADSLQMMLDWEPEQDGLPVQTASRAQLVENREALATCFRVAIAAELVTTVSGMDFASYDDAIARRDRVAERLDALALAAFDRGDDESGDVFDELRRALARDIAARGASLARVWSFTPAAPEPALVIANRIYGAAGVASRADEIVARNGVMHPGFVPGGRAIELLAQDDVA